MYIQTVKKKSGSVRKLSNYRGIFLVPIVSIIFEKLLKNRVTPLLEENMTKFQTGGVKKREFMTLRNVLTAYGLKTV